MWGALTPQQDTQTVKVFPMGAQLERLSDEKLPGTFTSTDLETGQTRIWSDSVMREPDGDLVHVFGAPFRVQFGHTYRVQMAHAKRGTSWAEVTVPRRVELDPLPPGGRPGRVRLRVRIPNTAPQVIPQADLEYLVQYDSADPRRGVTTSDVRQTVHITNPIDRRGEDWMLVIELDEHAISVAGQVPFNPSPGPCCNLELIQLKAHVHIVNAAWGFPGDTVTTTTVTQPGVVSNVENGFGLIGAGYTESVIIPVSDSVAKAGRFRADFD